MEPLTLFWQMTGLTHITWEALVMIGVGGVLLYVAIVREFEPIFLFSLGFSVILSHMPGSTMAEPGGLLYVLYEMGVKSGLFPALIFFGLGMLADFGPLIAMPSLLFVGAAAQMGIFVVLFVALLLSAWLGLSFDLADAAVVGMIGGASPPNIIFFADQLVPDRLGTVVVVLYINMTLLHLFQPVVMRLLTTEQERQVIMEPMRPLSRWERMLFPLVLLVPCLLLLPAIAPLLGLLAFGNLLRESGVLERIMIGLSSTAQTRLLPIVTLLFGLAVGGKLSAERFLSWETIAIFCLGLMALVLGSAGGIGMAKWLCHGSNGKVNPLIGAAGVAVVPLAARIANKLAVDEATFSRRETPNTFLLGHAMGANVAGVIGSIVAAGILLTVLKSG